jgi:uncharacterized protein YodC (DUF2158 family)
MEEIKIGDIVQMKSGGPKMTIQRFIGHGNEHIGVKATDEFYKMRGYKDGDVICQWFETNQLKDGVFAKASLMIVQ